MFVLDAVSMQYSSLFELLYHIPTTAASSAAAIASGGGGGGGGGHKRLPLYEELYPHVSYAMAAQALAPMELQSATSTRIARLLHDAAGICRKRNDTKLWHTTTSMLLLRPAEYNTCAAALRY